MRLEQNEDEVDGTKRGQFAMICDDLRLRMVRICICDDTRMTRESFWIFLLTRFAMICDNMIMTNDTHTKSNATRKNSRVSFVARRVNASDKKCQTMSHCNVGCVTTQLTRALIVKNRIVARCVNSRVITKSRTNTTNVGRYAKIRAYTNSCARVSTLTLPTMHRSTNRNVHDDDARALCARVARHDIVQIVASIVGDVRTFDDDARDDDVARIVASTLRMTRDT